MRKLTNIRPLGRYRHKESGKEHNIKKGRDMSRGTDVLFYLYRNSRQYISDFEFYRLYERID